MTVSGIMIHNWKVKSFAARSDRERYYNPAPVSAYLTQFEISVNLTVPGTHTYIYRLYAIR